MSWTPIQVKIRFEVTDLLIIGTWRLLLAKGIVTFAVTIMLLIKHLMFPSFHNVKLFAGFTINLCVICIVTFCICVALCVYMCVFVCLFASGHAYL